MSALKLAAIRVANEYPIEAYGHMEERACRHCGRDVEDYMRELRDRFDHTDRRAHEPDCSWIALRDALGLIDPH